MIVITCLQGEIHQDNCVHEKKSFSSWKSILSGFLMWKKHLHHRFDLQALFPLTQTPQICAMSSSEMGSGIMNLFGNSHYFYSQYSPKDPKQGGESFYQQQSKLWMRIYLSCLLFWFAFPASGDCISSYYKLFFKGDFTYKQKWALWNQLLNLDLRAVFIRTKTQGFVAVSFPKTDSYRKPKSRAQLP